MRLEGQTSFSQEIPDFREIPLGPRTRQAVQMAQQGSVWMAHHWLALANGGFLLALMIAAAVPVFRAFGLSWLGDPLFALYHLVCHQQPERSFHLFGYPMAFCQRDTAVYGSIALAGITFGFVRERLRPLAWKWYLLALIPIGVDGITQLLGIRESNWALRFLTGSIFGVATVWLAYPCLHRFAKAIIEDAETGRRGDTGTGIRQ